ncbi:hypothetical protein D3C81_1199360 [compost metagenome]
MRRTLRILEPAISATLAEQSAISWDGMKGSPFSRRPAVPVSIARPYHAPASVLGIPAPEYALRLC